MENNNISVKHYKVKVVKAKENPVRFVLGVISYAIFIWLLLLGITLLVYVGSNKIREMKGDTTPAKYNAYVVLTGSMIPNINIKDVVITKGVDPSTLKKGDVITFLSSDPRVPNITVTHRIREVFYDSSTGKYNFRTKGDNNNTADMYLANSDNVYGKVIIRIPKLGYLQDLLATSGGWIIVVLIPCLAILSFDIMKVGKKIISKGKKSK